MTSAHLRITALLLVAAGCQQPGPIGAGAPAISFDDVPAGELPPVWRIATTGDARPHARWTVAADADAASGAQTLALTEPRHGAADAFNLCWTGDVSFRDGVLAVAVRADAGRIDRGGGLAWRIQDADNYYVCRYNPLEANYRVYVVVDGVRTQLATAAVPGDGARWRRLAVQHQGDHIVCWLDDRPLLDVSDGRIPAAGGVGFWTKADACTSFDDLVVGVAR